MNGKSRPASEAGDRQVDDSEDDYISLPSSSRPNSPPQLVSLRGWTRQIPDITQLDLGNSLDPLRKFPRDLNLNIFARLEISHLIRCSRTCKRWNDSPILNYIWFTRFSDRALDHPEPILHPKWTKREAKQNWRVKYGNVYRTDDLTGPINVQEAEQAANPVASAQQIRQQSWAAQAAADAAPKDKKDARAAYKALDGRKSRTKSYNAQRDQKMAQFE